MNALTSGYSTPVLDLPQTISLENPFETVDSVTLEDTDLFTQKNFKSLINKNYKANQLGYIIAIAKDKIGHISFNDGCSFIRNYYVHGREQAPLTRSQIDQVSFYRYFPSAGNSTQNSKFKYLCNLEDLSEEWFLRYIAAHDPNPIQLDQNSNGNWQRASEQYKIGMLYEFGPTNLDLKVSNQAANFFLKNEEEAFYWYQRSAEGRFSLAFQRLSNFYSEGKGGAKQSERKAFKLIKKAANCQPDSVAILKLLALRYLQGNGVEQNKLEAQKIVEQINKMAS